MKPIRIGICSLLAFSVLAHGAVEPWSEAILEIGAALLLTIWAVAFARGKVSGLRWNPLLWPISALLGVAMLQYALRLSELPFLTQIELLKLFALAILLFVAVQAFETREEWQGFIWFVLVLGFVVSVFGILQHFTFNGKLYWVREMAYGGIPFGPYVNRNHFAGLMELIIPAGLSMLFVQGDRRDRLPLIGILTLLPIGAIFLAASRAGITCLLLEAGILLVLLFFRGPGRVPLKAAAVVIVITGALVAWLGVGQALERFSTYRQLEVTETRRMEMSRDSWRIFRDHPVMGTGLGTLQEVFPRYETLYDGKTVNHSHNDYVEMLAETGFAGGICCVVFLLVLFRQSWARLKGPKNAIDLALHIGAFTACCGLLAHSFVDFNLHIPSNALLFLLQAALATSVTPHGGFPHRLGRAQDFHKSRVVTGGVPV